MMILVIEKSTSLFGRDNPPRKWKTIKLKIEVRELSDTKESAA